MGESTTVNPLFACPVARRNLFGHEGRNSPPSAGPDGAHLSGASIEPQRILVVDDDSGIRNLNAAALSSSGYEVDSAEDGAAAWDALNSRSYDLIITDNNMPKVTGVDLLKKLRSARMDMPVIMATGTWPAEEFARFPWLQPTAGLLKPYSFRELLRTVKKVLVGVESAAQPLEPLAIGQFQP